MQLFVDQDYLNSAFEEYGISKSSTAFPDLRPFLEQTLSEEPISAEVHAKFRKVLGRLSWLAQTRQDILILIAMLSTGQSCPKPGHEKALRAVLRFMLLHMKMSQKFPPLDLRTFLRRTSVWKCIVMLDLPLCKLLRGEALLVV